MGDPKPVTVSGISGQTLKKTLLNLRFTEFIKVSYPDLKFEPPPRPDSIYPLEGGKLHLAHYSDSQRVKEQWIYIFELKHSRKESGEYVSLAGELWADKNGKYQQVAWGKNTRDEYSEKDERPKGSARDTFMFQWEGEAYVFTSLFPISADRLKEYLHSPEVVKSRSHRLSLSSPYYGLDGKPYPSDSPPPPPGGLRIVAGKKNTYEMFLINHRKVLLNLHEKYSESLDEFNQNIGDEAKAEERLLVSLTLSTAQSYIKAKGWNTEAHLTEMDLKKARYDQWSLHKDILVAQKKKEWWSFRLGLAMKETIFIEMGNDAWSGNEEAKAEWVELEGSLTEELYQSDSGREYINWTMNQKANLYEKLLKSNGETGKRAFKISRKGIQTLDKAIDYIINFAILKTGAAKKIREAYQLFLPNTFRMLDIPLDEIGVVFIKGKETMRRSIGDFASLEAAFFEAEYEKIKSIEISDKIKKVMPKLVLFVNLINFTYEARSMQGKKSGVQTYAQIAAIASAAASTVSTLKDIKIKKVKIIGTFGAIFDSVSSALNAYSAAKNDDDVRAIAYGMTAAASLMMIAGITNPVFAMGLILYVVGSVLLAIFSTTPLEEWFRKCKWGNKFQGTTNNPIATQIKDLLVIIGKPEVEFQLSLKDGKTKTTDPDKAEYLSLILRPTYFVVPETKYKVYFKLSEFMATLTETIEVPNDKDLIVYDNNGSVDQIIHNWTVSQTGLKLMDKNFELEYAIRPKFLSSWKDFSKEGYGDAKYVTLI